MNVRYDVQPIARPKLTPVMNEVLIRVYSSFDDGTFTVAFIP